MPPVAMAGSAVVAEDRKQVLVVVPPRGDRRVGLCLLDLPADHDERHGCAPDTNERTSCSSLPSPWSVRRGRLQARGQPAAPRTMGRALEASRCRYRAAAPSYTWLIPRTASLKTSCASLTCCLLPRSPYQSRSQRRPHEAAHRDAHLVAAFGRQRLGALVERQRQLLRLQGGNEDLREPALHHEPGDLVVAGVDAADDVSRGLRNPGANPLGERQRGRHVGRRGNGQDGRIRRQLREDEIEPIFGIILDHADLRDEVGGQRLIADLRFEVRAIGRGKAETTPPPR